MAVIIGTVILIKERKRFFKNSLEKRANRNKRILAVFVVFCGVLFQINNLDFRRTIFDQYHGDQGQAPYQNVIDYVQGKGGLVFWAHPEAENISEAGGIKIVTEKHVGDFYNTKDYTGFSVFYEGYDEIGRPGCLWDKVLEEYLEGKRDMPVWAIAGLAFDYSGDLRQAVADLRNIALVDEFSEKGLLDALGSGKVYVIRGPRSSLFRLDDFSLTDDSGDEEKIIGETLYASGKKVIISMKGFFDADPLDDILSIHVIKNGEIIRTFKEKAVFDIRLEDDTGLSDDSCFYRLEIRSHGLHVVTNPVFVRM